MKKYLLFISLAVLVVAAAFTFREAITISGKVIDNTGSPVMGASILIKGSQKATTSNANGEFTITVPSKKTLLVVTSVGFDSKEVKVGDNLK